MRTFRLTDSEKSSPNQSAPIRNGLKHLTCSRNLSPSLSDAKQSTRSERNVGPAKGLTDPESTTAGNFRKVLKLGQLYAS